MSADPYSSTPEPTDATQKTYVMPEPVDATVKTYEPVDATTKVYPTDTTVTVRQESPPPEGTQIGEAVVVVPSGTLPVTGVPVLEVTLLGSLALVVGAFMAGAKRWGRP